MRRWLKRTVDNAMRWRRHNAAKGEELPASGLAAVRWLEPAEFVRCSGSDDLDQPARQDAATPSRNQAVANGSTPTQNTRSLIPNWIASEFKKSDGETTGGRSR